MAAKISFSGKLTHDPQMRTANGKSVCSMAVAVRRDKDKTDFYEVSVWGARGETCAKYLHKGDGVAVWGEFTPNLWDKRDGTQGLNLSVFAYAVEFTSQASKNSAANEIKEPYHPTDSSDDDLSDMFN